MHPIDAKPKELREADVKKNGVRNSYVVLAVAALISVLLILGSSVRLLVATAQQNKLQKRIEELSYVQDTYDESSKVQQEEKVYEDIDRATLCNNEQLLPLINQLEEQLPREIHVKSIQTDDSMVILNMVADKKVTVGQMLLNFQDVTLLHDLDIPQMVEETDDAGNKTWTYTLNAYYTPINYDGDIEDVTEETTEGETNE